MIYCENCGKQVNDEAQFCSHCGNRIVNLADDKPRSTNIMSKNVFIGFIASAVVISIILGILIGTSIEANKKPETVQLTQENFNEYFTYEISGRFYDGDNGDGEITITFLPLKNINLENASITIIIDECAESTHIYEVFDGRYHEYVARSATIPYDGKFSVKFYNYGESGSGLKYDHCVISWFNIYNYTPIEERIDVAIESVSGTIILK